MSPLLPRSARQEGRRVLAALAGAAASALLRSRDLKIEGYPELKRLLS